nr:hypothetical protein [Tanacetum cinerariifolium]
MTWFAWVVWLVVEGRLVRVSSGGSVVMWWFGWWCGDSVDEGRLAGSVGRPGSPHSRAYEAPTPGSGWANTPGGSYSEAGGAGLDIMSPVLGGDTDGPWFLPNILVNVRSSGDDASLGVIREVLLAFGCNTCNTPKYTSMQWNTTSGCYFIIQTHESQ